VDPRRADEERSLSRLVLVEEGGLLVVLRRCMDSLGGTKSWAVLEWDAGHQGGSVVAVARRVKERQRMSGSAEVLRLSKRAGAL
jgi:hypothetical protein